MNSEVVVHQDPKSPVSEIFRTLRTNIQFMTNSKKMQSVLVTSTFPGEGKSYISINLAVTFAQANQKVLIIDADMRKGRQYKILHAAPKPGLSNYLSTIDEDKKDISYFVQNTEIENLFFIPAGDVPPNPSELLISPKMMDLLENLKDVFDIIIIDGTPAELVTDSVVLSRMTDTTVVVTNYKKTKKENLKKTVNNIRNVGGNIAGVVINKMPISSKKYEDTYYYGSSEKGESKETLDEHIEENDNIIIQNSDIKEDKEVFNKLKNIKNKDSDEISFEKTKEALRQINEFLSKEDKK